MAGRAGPWYIESRRHNYNRTPLLFMVTTLAIVIPAYNEGSRIRQTLLDILAYASKAPYKTEVIVVNDGSRDNTAEIVEALMEQYKGSGCELRLLTNTPNRGKGY